MSVRPYKNKKGEIVPGAYVIDYYPAGGKGKQVKKVVKGFTLAKAQQLELALIREYVHAPPPFDPTVNDAWPEWLKEYARDSAESTITDITYAAGRLLPYLGSWHLSQLTVETFTGYMDKRRTDIWRPPIKNPDPQKTYAPGKPTSKVRINTELKYFGLFIKYCVQKKYMLPLPFAIPKFKKLPIRIPNLPNDDELRRILAKCSPDAKLALMLYNYAGLRKREGLDLTVEDVFLEDGIIRVIGKGNKEREVVITGPLHDELAERIEKIKTGLLLRNPQTGEAYKDLRKAIEGAAERAGVRKNIYNHLLRHNHLSDLHAAGVSMADIQEQAGHSDIQTTRKYVHIKTQGRLQRIKAASCTKKQ